MAAEIDCMVLLTLEGLTKKHEFIDRAQDGTTPTATTGRQVRTLAVANTAEALDVGGVTTSQIIGIRAIDYDLDIDLDFVSSFDKDLTVKAGEPAALIPNPAGTVYIKNNGTDETPQYEYIVIGT